VTALAGVAATFACTGENPNIDVTDDAGATSSSTSSGSTGGSSGGDAAMDAGPRCDPLKPFENPQLVPGINSENAEVSATLSGDELTVYLSRRPPGQPGLKESDLYVASRTAITEPFGAVTALASVNTPDIDDNVSTPSDGLTIYFHSSRPDAGSDSGLEDIWRAVRPSLFTSPLPAEPVTSVNSPSNDVDPYITADGNTLYFTSSRDRAPDAGYSFRIFRAEKLGGGFTTPIPLELEYDAGVSQLSQPVVSAEGKTLFVSYIADASAAAAAAATIWSAHRDNPLGAFKDFGPLPGGAFGAGRNLPTWVSPDGCHLYFRSNRPGGLGDEDIWMASRGL
jgi:hypothetical protein